jgi:hypothetical protein
MKNAAGEEVSPARARLQLEQDEGNVQRGFADRSYSEGWA